MKELEEFIIHYGDNKKVYSWCNKVSVCQERKDFRMMFFVRGCKNESRPT